MSVEIGGEIAGLGLRDPCFRHRRVGREILRRHDPMNEIIARIVDDAGDIDPFLKARQCAANLAIRTGDPWDLMASGAAVPTKDRWCSGGIAASGQHARDLQSLLRSLCPVYADHSAKYCNGCRTQLDPAVSIMGGCAEHGPLPYRHLLSIALPLRAPRRRKSSRLEST